MRSAIDGFDCLDLGAGEAAVGVVVIRTHGVGEVPCRREVAAERIVDDTVGDSVVGIASREHGVGQHVGLGQAVQLPVAGGVECERAGEIVLQHRLHIPVVGQVQSLQEGGRGAGDDAVKIRGEALRRHKPLTPASGAAFVVGVLGRSAVIGLDRSLGRLNSGMQVPVAVVHLGLAVVEREGRAGL